MTLVHSWKNPSEFVRWLSRKRLVTVFSKLNGFQLSSTSTGFLVNSLDLLSFTGFFGATTKVWLWCSMGLLRGRSPPMGS